MKKNRVDDLHAKLWHARYFGNNRQSEAVGWISQWRHTQTGSGDPELAWLGSAAAIIAALGLPPFSMTEEEIINTDVEVLAERLKRTQGHDHHVTADQMAGIVSRSKRTIERLAAKTSFPLPDVAGGGGKPNEWKWSMVKPILESEYGRKLPEVFPTDTISQTTTN